MTAAARTPARAALRAHTAAIHALKAKCGLSDDDYRALLYTLTGKRSSKDCTTVQQLQVRQHLQKLADAMAGKATTKQQPARPWLSQADFEAKRKQLSPLERKLHALWAELGRAGKLDQPGSAGLQAWVQRQLGVSHVRFCTSGQLHSLIESAKMWLGRG